MSSGRTLLAILAIAITISSQGQAARDSKQKFVQLNADALLMNSNFSGQGFDPLHDPWTEVISWNPRAVLYHNFLSDEEAAHIAKLAYPQLKRSTVVGDQGQGVVDEIRTSYGMFIRRMHDEVIQRIEKRVSAWTHLPEVNMEDMQVLRYGIGQKYGAHMDSAEEETAVGPTRRAATVLMYLNDCEFGGETCFPLTKVTDPDYEKRFGPFSSCAKGHAAFRPTKRDALLFYSMNPNGSFDMMATHTGCPVVRGSKWVGIKWIHDKPFRPHTWHTPKPEELPTDPGLCLDNHPRCAEWANSGECSKNPAFMVGDSNPDSGNCRRSCGVCEPCASGDLDCIARNRRKAGFLVMDEEELKVLGVKMSDLYDLGSQGEL